MFPTKRLLVVTLVTVFTFARQSSCAQQNASTISSERSSRQQSNVNVDASVNSPSSYSITPSFSYQFHTNDDEHLDQIVSSHHSVVPNSFNSDDITANAQNQDSVASASTNQASISSDNAVRPPSYYYPNPTFDLPSYQRQENYTSENTQQSRVSERKKQQKKSQPNRDSAPEAFLNQKYTSQAAQVETNAAAASSIPTTASKLTSSSYQQPAEKQNTVANPTWNPIVQDVNPTSSAYLRPPKNQQGSNISPVAYQRRQSPQYTAPSYSQQSVGLQPVAAVASQRSMSTDQEAAHKSIAKQKTNRRKILQSRADTYSPQNEDAEQDEQSDGDNGGDEETHEDDQEHDADPDEYYPQYNSVYDPANPQLKELGFPNGGGFGGSPFTGPGGPLDGSLPPAPPPLKGSIDYILIPLILIGLAGPIFVVLYVILGGFEARLSPIQRSLNSGYSDYKPYIDTITSSVGRALEEYECFDYAVCRFSGISSNLGLSRTTSATIESALTSVTPKEYIPTLKKLFTIMETPKGDCNKYKCSAVAE